MTETSSETITFVHDVLGKTIRPDLTALSTEDAGRELANFINQKSNEKAGTELLSAILAIITEAINDPAQIDFYVYIFHYFFAHLNNQIQNKYWVGAIPDEAPRGRDLALKLLGAELREGVDNFHLQLPKEFLYVPSNKVFSAKEKIRRNFAIDDARCKYININSLIGRFWALDVVDTSGLTIMLLDFFCDNESENLDPDDDELDESEVNIESVCALIRATSGKLELSVGKPRFTEYLKFLEEKLQLSNISFSLKMKISETLRPYNEVV